MRYAADHENRTVVGVEPQPRDAPDIATIEVTDERHGNLITIVDKAQAQEVINLIADACQINGWGEIQLHVKEGQD